MKELVFHRLFAAPLGRHPDKVGVCDGPYRATFTQHADRVLRLAHAIRHQLGMAPGDRFAVMSCNSHRFLELYHAGLLGAGVISPLDLRLGGSELQFLLADSGARVAFVDAVFAGHFLRHIAPVRADLPLRHIVLIGNADVTYDHDYEQLLASGEPIVPPEPDETDPALLMYTGGTTGVPRGALFEQRAVVLNLYHIGLCVGFDDHRVYLHQTPMFHAASLAGVIGIPATGATSVFVPMFDPEPVMATIESYGVDGTFMVPMMIAMMLDHPNFRPERLSTLRDLVYGASPMPPVLLARLLRALPELGVWQGYGTTESSSVLTMLTARDHRRGGDVLRSAGRPVLGVEVSVRHADGGACAVGCDGEVWARGGNLFREYWHRPEQTAEALVDGWYRTGDLGHLDAEGFLYLVDHVQGEIITDGASVSAR